MATLLLIDDDPDLLRDRVSHVLPAPAHRVEIAKTGAEGLERVAAACPDVILLDLRLPDQSGLDILRQLRRIDARIPVVMVTVARSSDSAIEAMRHGAYDYLLKPIDLQKLDHVINEALKVSRLMREPAVVAETPPDEELPGEAIIGCCPGMQEAYKAIGRVADQTFPVLITGESGTGKELVARAIYQHGPRAQAPFLALNCAAIPENLLESELFGHEKGAFTGADRRRIGKFEQCNGGTLFLDEIGDMPPATQAKMLRVLQEQAFERVGGNETIRTDVRLIAATHRDLKAWSDEGKFRPDLYYRLGVFTIHLPPLRERGDDLLMLVQHVGPKLALAILSVLSPDELVSAIAREDVERLDAVPGVGAKVAERVVRELRDKTAELKLVASERVEELDGAADGADGGASELDDAVSALVNLGYKPIQARRAVDAAAARGGGAKRELEVIIRESLAVLAGER